MAHAFGDADSRLGNGFDTAVHGFSHSRTGQTAGQAAYDATYDGTDTGPDDGDPLKHGGSCNGAFNHTDTAGDVSANGRYGDAAHGVDSLHSRQFSLGGTIADFDLFDTGPGQGRQYRNRRPSGQ